MKKRIVIPSPFLKDELTNLVFKIYQKIIETKSKKARKKLYLRCGPKKLRRVQVIASHRSRLKVRPLTVRKELQKIVQEIDRFFTYMQKKRKKK